jgi:hypothetical protein
VAPAWATLAALPLGRTASVTGKAGTAGTGR